MVAPWFLSMILLVVYDHGLTPYLNSMGV
jgi:hypothetical protein